MLLKPDFASHGPDSTTIVTALMHRYNLLKTDPLYGYWFFEAYYESFATALAKLSPKFVPTTPHSVEELLSFKADM